MNLVPGLGIAIAINWLISKLKQKNSFVKTTTLTTITKRSNRHVQGQ